LKKEEIFSKLNIKDNSGKLEKILNKKPFSSDAKNLLLNMLYKIEASYEDYCKVKVEVKPKRTIIEDILGIIEADCKDVELVKPKLEENKILKNKKSVGIRKERKIVSYPNEKAIMYALYNIKRNKFEIKSEYKIIKKCMENLLNIGYNQDMNEIIRDFDGWSWNINVEDIEDININLIYQNLQMLVRKRIHAKLAFRLPI
jgi:hypothetical protein